MISRETFVKICTETIQLTRKKICIANQEKGYLQYADAINEGYIDNLREILTHNNKLVGYYSPVNFYNDIKDAGIGACSELNEFLLVKLAKILSDYTSFTRFRLVSSVDCDHAFIHVRIELAGELCSLWEIDAWDPRVIDISLKQNKEIKNKAAIDYGHDPKILYSFLIDELEDGLEEKKEHLQNPYRLFVSKPTPGNAKYLESKKRKNIEHSDVFYENYTLETAYKKRKLNKEGKVDTLQAVSSWQLKP